MRNYLPSAFRINSVHLPDHGDLGACITSLEGCDDAHAAAVFACFGGIGIRRSDLFLTAAYIGGTIRRSAYDIPGGKLWWP